MKTLVPIFSLVLGFALARTAASAATYAHFDDTGKFVRLIEADPGAVNLTAQAADGQPRTVPVTGTYDPETESATIARDGKLVVTALSQEEIDRIAADKAVRAAELAERQTLRDLIAGLRETKDLLRAASKVDPATARERDDRTKRLESAVADLDRAVVWLLKEQMRDQ